MSPYQGYKFDKFTVGGAVTTGEVVLITACHAVTIVGAVTTGGPVPNRRYTGHMNIFQCQTGSPNSYNK